MSRLLPKLLLSCWVGCLSFVLAFPASLNAADFIPASQPARLEWFTRARLGLFIHWGLYSVAGGQWAGRDVPGYGEWIMSEGQIPVSEYERLAAQFNPKAMDVRTWVAAAKQAGATYIVFTAKHHDGFCLWGTHVTPFNVVDATPLRKDVLREVAAACRQEGLKFGIYYSIADWRHRELAGHPQWGDKPNPADERSAAIDPQDPRVARYVAMQLRPQLCELITQYDPDLLWFDGEFVLWWNSAHGQELEKFCRKLKPNLVINDRVGKRLVGDGDYATVEQSLPTPLPTRAWEACITMNDTWGYKASDQHWKSASEIAAMYRRVRAGGGNLLLNVGPDGNGQIPSACSKILSEFGNVAKSASVEGKP